MNDNYKSFRREAFGFGTPDSDLMVFPNFVEAVSTFYASETYWAIRRANPAMKVLLEPQAILLGPDASLTVKPLVDPLVPTLLVVDIAGYSHLHGVMPLLVDMLAVSLRTSPSRIMENCGLLVSTVDTHPLGEFKTCTHSSHKEKPRASHWLFDGKARKEADALSGPYSALPLNIKKTLVLPNFVEGRPGPFTASMSDYVRSSHSATGGIEAQVLNPWLENFALIAIAAAPLVSTTPSSEADQAMYVAQFDAGLAKSLERGAALSSGQKKNLRLIERLQQSEIDVRAKRDEVIARDLLIGPFGKNFRASRQKAYEGYGSHMAKMWLTTATSLATGTAMIRSATTSAALLAANNTTFDQFNQKMEATGMEYLGKVAPSLSMLEKASVTVMGESVTIEIAEQAALRGALKAIYERRKTLE